MLKSVIKKKFEDKKDLVDKEKKIDFLSNTLKLYNLRKFMSSFFQIKNFDIDTFEKIILNAQEFAQKMTNFIFVYYLITIPIKRANQKLVILLLKI